VPDQGDVERSAPRVLRRSGDGRGRYGSGEHRDYQDQQQAILQDLPLPVGPPRTRRRPACTPATI
ncbi:MAG: hypothetical protein AVDCRST_MAG12-1223, partial [uncultured Rubrobacteraceae bacterium]